MSEVAIFSETVSVAGAGEISDELARDIIHGAYPVGSKLPTERSLARKFTVTRHVIREALKRLESVGLVRIRQGSGIFAEPVSIKATIELMHLLIRNPDGSLNGKVLVDVMEYLKDMASIVVKLAAERRTDEQLAECKDLLRKRRQSLNDPERLHTIDVDFMKLLGESTQNLLYDLLYESIAKVASQMRLDFDITVSDHMRIHENAEALVNAIEAKDPERALEVTLNQMEIYRDIMGRGLAVVHS